MIQSWRTPRYSLCKTYSNVNEMLSEVLRSQRWCGWKMCSMCKRWFKEKLGVFFGVLSFFPAPSVPGLWHWARARLGSAGIFLRTDQGRPRCPSLLLVAVISPTCDWFTAEKEREEQVRRTFRVGGDGGGSDTDLELNLAAEARVPSAPCFGCLWLQQTGLYRVVSSAMGGVRAGEKVHCVTGDRRMVGSKRSWCGGESSKPGSWRWGSESSELSAASAVPAKSLLLFLLKVHYKPFSSNLIMQTHH